MSNGDLIAATVERLERAAAVLKRHGADTLDMAEGWASPLRAGGNGIKAKGSVSDPTGEVATSAADGTEGVYRQLSDDLASLEQLAATVTHAVIRYRRLSPDEARAFFAPMRGRQSTLSACASIYCDDRAEVGQTHCPPCAAYLANHPDARQVPRLVIAQRRTMREHRRRYVTGPLAEAEGTA